MSADEAEIKEWVKVVQDVKGNKTVTVSMQQANLSSRWVVKTYNPHIKKAVKEARDGARAALDQVRVALSELDAEEEAA